MSNEPLLEEQAISTSVPAVSPPPGPEGSKLRRAVGTFLEGARRFVRTEPLGAVSLAVVVLFVLVALFAPWIAPYDPVRQFRTDLLSPPSASFWLGTDEVGRDLLSRVIFGARTSLMIALGVTLCGLIVGTVIGLLSGYFGRWPDMVLQRISDAIQAVPPLVLLLFLAVLLGPSIRNTIIALSVVVIPQFNRIVRGEAIRLREEPFVEAARATGAGHLRIMTKHLLRNLLAPMFTLATLVFASVMIVESALSFLGIGTPPPTPSWGRMLSDGLRYVERAPWIVLSPGIALSVAVFGFNLLGDALRDFFDPRLRR